MALPVQKCSPEATNTDLTQETLKSKIYCGSSGLLHQICQKDAECEVLHTLPYANSPQSLQVTFSALNSHPTDQCSGHQCSRDRCSRQRSLCLGCRLLKVFPSQCSPVSPIRFPLKGMVWLFPFFSVSSCFSENLLNKPKPWANLFP